MRHDDSVLAAAFLPDRNVLATASADGALKFWKLNGQEITFDPNKRLERASLIAFSSNGNRVATVNRERNAIKWWDTNIIAPNDLHIQDESSYKEISINLISLSPGGKKIAASLMASLRITTTNSNKIEKIVIWDTGTNEARPVEINLPAPNAHFTALAFSEDNRLAIGFSDGSVRLWDDSAGRLSDPFQMKAEARVTPQGGPAGETSTSKGVQALAFSRDNEILVSGDNSGIITAWDVKEQKSLPHRIANSYPILSLAFSSNRKILAASSHNGSVKVWDTSDLSISARSDSRTNPHISVVLKGHAGAVLSMAFVPDTYFLASTSDDKTAKLWDTSKKDEAEIPSIDLDRYPTFTSATFTLDATGEILAIQDFKEVGSTLLLADRNREGLFLWPEFARRGPEAGPKEFENVSSVAFSSQGFLSIYRKEKDKGIIKLWAVGNQGNTHSLTPLGKEWTVPATDISSPSLSEDKKLISASKFSSDGKILVIWSPEAGIRRYDVATGEETIVPILTPPKQNLGSSAFSPDLNIFVQSEGPRLKVFNSRTGEWFLTDPGPLTAPVNSLAFSSDGKLLAIGHTDYTVRLWDTATWTNPRILSGHNSPVQALVFSRDNKRLATGSQDGVINLWDISFENWDMNDRLVKDLKLRRELVSIRSLGNSGVMTLTFAPDEKSLIAGYTDGRIKIAGFGWR
jgi:WD40 repeat protein